MLSVLYSWLVLGLGLMHLTSMFCPSTYVLGGLSLASYDRGHVGLYSIFTDSRTCLVFGTKVLWAKVSNKYSCFLSLTTSLKMRHFF